MKKIYLLSLLMLAMTSFVARAQFSLSGEIRPRTELYNGNNVRLATSDDRIGIATQQRTRLYFNYVDSTGLKIVFSPQVINFWGQSPQFVDLLADGIPGGVAESTFSVFEAYAEYKASDWYTLKAGRQAISYGDQRWFGALGWAASGRAHDAFVNKLTFGKVNVDVGVALNQTRHTNGTNVAAIQGVRSGYKSLQYLWATFPVGKLKVQAMATNEVLNASAEGVEYQNRTTFGILPSLKTKDVAINASAYWQTADNLSASLYAFDLTYKGLGLPITIGADIVSGDDASTAEDEAWKQPFGTNHKFYGFMDFFYVGPGEAVGLNDFYIKTVLKTGGKSKLIAFVHQFSTNQEIMNLEGEMESGSYGTEIDLVYNLNVSKGFNFKFGYSTIFATELLEAYKGGDSGQYSQWAWMQLTFKPKFL